MKTPRKNKPEKSKTAAPAVLAAIRLSLHCPHGDTVDLAGSFNSWQPTALTREGDEWHADLHLAPGDYEYLFVVNGCWLPDPACTEGRPNPYGGENSVLHVRATPAKGENTSSG